MRAFKRTLRAFQRAVFFESRHGRAAEIAAWSNAVAALGAAASVHFAVHAWVLTAVTAPLMFVALRLALVNRKTLWVAAAFGTLSVAITAGGLGWLFGHVAEREAVPPIACAVAAALAGLVPAWAYTQLASIREVTRDSLVDASSVPSSRL